MKLRTIRVGNIDETERSRLIQHVLEEVVANAVARIARGNIDVEIAVSIRVTDRHAVRFGAGIDLETGSLHQLW